MIENCTVLYGPIVLRSTAQPVQYCIVLTKRDDSNEIFLHSDGTDTAGDHDRTQSCSLVSQQGVTTNQEQSTTQKVSLNNHDRIRRTCARIR